MADSVQIATMRPMHYQIVDWLVINQASKGWAERCCAHFKISRSWLSIVMNSDCFKEHYQERLATHHNMLAARLTALQADVGERALHRLAQIVEDDETDDRVVLDAADRAMKNLGLTPSRGSAPTFEREVSRTQTREVSPGVLVEARETYREITHGKPKALPAPEAG